MAGSHQNGPIHGDLHGERIQFDGRSGSGDPRVSSARIIFTSFVGIAEGEKTNHSKIHKDEAAERKTITLCLQSVVLASVLTITSAGKTDAYGHYPGSQYFGSFTHRN